MGNIVYGYKSPLSESGENYAEDINRMLWEAGIDPGVLYQEFLDCPDDEKISFFRDRDVGPFRDSVKNYVLLFWRLTLLEQSRMSRDLKGVVRDIMYELADVYNFGYYPPPKEMAQELRKGVKNDFTQLMRSLIRYLMPSHPIAQNLALTLIQPAEFERYQSKVFNGDANFKVVADKCVDGRILCIRAPNGKEKTYRLRSLETLIGKVKKDQDTSK